MEKKADLVFVPLAGISHLVPTVQFVKHLLARDDSFSTTILIMPENYTPQMRAFVESSTTPDIQFIHLPLSEGPPPPPDTQPGIPFFSHMVENHKPSIKTTLTQLINTHHSITGLVVGMFMTGLIEVATELNIPSYVYFTSSAATLGLFLHIPILDAEILTEFKDYSGEIFVPAFVNPVPPLVLPTSMLNRKGQAYAFSLRNAKRFKQAKGIIVNSLFELQSLAVNSFSDPKVYPVGPLLHLEGDREAGSHKEIFIVKWLDNQPPLSVVFICFGSRGTVSAEQVKEIANGLEKSGHRFLWSLRRPAKTRFEAPSEYTNFNQVLPQGFLERTKERGLVCGWAPQVEVLAHKATGGFLSHCGWNSILESLWFGVPILAWPLDAEQKLNAFELVRELGLAVGMREDYNDDRAIFTAEEIESAVSRLMDSDDSQVIRKKVKDMREICRMAVQEGGSSFSSLGCLIDDLKGPGGRMQHITR